MSKIPSNQNVQYFNHLTERLRRGRIRIRPEYVPELAAYLYMLARRYERMYQSARQVCRDTRDANLAGVLDYVQRQLQLMQTLIDGLSDGFDGHDWTAATDYIGEQLGVKPGADLPDRIETFGKVSTPQLEL